MPVSDPPPGLFVSGLCPEGDGTVLLLSPDEPGFWAIFTAAPEFGDGRPDPLDRWSKRLIAPYAAALGGRAVFPSDPPPAPFARWAVGSGRCHVSPTGMLVHATRGLFISFRGAVVVPGRTDDPAPSVSDPCAGCARPCLTACPVGAFRPAYDVERCHAGLDGAAAGCLRLGCAARRACPLSAGCGRLPRQSAWHMKDFHP